MSTSPEKDQRRALREAKALFADLMMVKERFPEIDFEQILPGFADAQADMELAEAEIEFEDRS